MPLLLADDCVVDQFQNTGQVVFAQYTVVLAWCLPFPLLLSGLVALGLYHACKCMYILGYSFYCMFDKVLLLVRCDLKVLFSFCVLLLYQWSPISINMLILL